MLPVCLLDLLLLIWSTRRTRTVPIVHPRINIPMIINTIPFIESVIPSVSSSFRGPSMKMMGKEPNKYGLAPQQTAYTSRRRQKGPWLTKRSYHLTINNTWLNIGLTMTLKSSWNITSIFFILVYLKYFWSVFYFNKYLYIYWVTIYSASKKCIHTLNISKSFLHSSDLTPLDFYWALFYMYTLACVKLTAIWWLI